MATIDRRPNGKWRAQVRREGHVLSKTFVMKGDADAWVRDTERAIDKGEDPTVRRLAPDGTFGSPIIVAARPGEDSAARICLTRAFTVKRGPKEGPRGRTFYGRGLNHLLGAVRQWPRCSRLDRMPDVLSFDAGIGVRIFCRVLNAS